MDNDHNLGSKRLIQAIGQVEVLAIFFPLFGYTLIVDTRHNASVAPAIIAEEMAGSVEARLVSFARLRPELPLPEKLAVAPWLGSIRALTDLGIPDAIVNRWHALGYPEREPEISAAFRQLARVERTALRELIAGSASKALWQRPR